MINTFLQFVNVPHNYSEIVELIAEEVMIFALQYYCNDILLMLFIEAIIPLMIKYTIIKMKIRRDIK